MAESADPADCFSKLQFFAVPRRLQSPLTHLNSHTGPQRLTSRLSSDYFPGYKYIFLVRTLIGSRESLFCLIMNRVPTPPWPGYVIRRPKLLLCKSPSSLHPQEQLTGSWAEQFTDLEIGVCASPNPSLFALLGNDVCVVLNGRESSQSGGQI